jgi:hypothetical protein
LRFVQERYRLGDQVVVVERGAPRLGACVALQDIAGDLVQGERGRHGEQPLALVDQGEEARLRDGQRSVEVGMLELDLIGQQACPRLALVGAEIVLQRRDAGARRARGEAEAMVPALA